MDEYFLHADAFADAVRARLDSLGLDTPVEVLGTIDSTNTECLRRLRSKRISGDFALIALRQDSGHGRLGRKWFSDPRASIAMSVCVGIEKSARVMESFTVRAGLSVCVRLEELCGAKLFLKWPNDIYAPDGRKIAGMLAELEIGADGATAVFGIGLNVDFSNVAESEIPEEIRGSVCALGEVAKIRPDFADTAAAEIRAIVEAKKKYLENLPEAFEKYDWLRGREISAIVGNTTVRGIADGIDPRGRLGILADSGETKFLCGGEATIRKKL